MKKANAFNPAKQPDPLAKKARWTFWAGVTGGKKPDSPELAAGILARRRLIGYASITLGVGGIGALGWYSFKTLHDLLPYGPTIGISDTIVIAGLLAHAIITVAIAMFCYQLIRAGERLLVPHWLWNRQEDVELIRALVGVEPPINSAIKTLKDMAAVVEPFAKLATRAQTPPAP